MQSFVDRCSKASCTSSVSTACGHCNKRLKADITFSIVKVNTLVDARARCGEMGNIQSALEEVTRHDVTLNVVTYSSIFKGYCDVNHVDKPWR